MRKFDHDPFWNWVALPANGDELIHLDIMGEAYYYWVNEWTVWGSTDAPEPGLRT